MGEGSQPIRIIQPDIISAVAARAVIRGIAANGSIPKKCLEGKRSN